MYKKKKARLATGKIPFIDEMRLLIRSSRTSSVRFAMMDFNEPKTPSSPETSHYIQVSDSCPISTGAGYYGQTGSKGVSSTSARNLTARNTIVFSNTMLEPSKTSLSDGR